MAGTGREGAKAAWTEPVPQTAFLPQLCPGENTQGCAPGPWTLLEETPGGNQVHIDLSQSTILIQDPD